MGNSIAAKVGYFLWLVTLLLQWQACLLPGLLATVDDLNILHPKVVSSKGHPGSGRDVWRINNQWRVSGNPLFQEVLPELAGI